MFHGNGAATEAPAGGAPAGGAPASEWIRDIRPQDFPLHVVKASMEVPVLVDFWGPSFPDCARLTPMLERIVSETGGAVRLAKMNVEAHPEVAQQLQIASFPTVMIFLEGRPLDGFVGVPQESQLRAMVAKLAGDMPPPAGETATEEGEQALAAGDAATAARCFAEALQADPQSPRAIGGLARAHLACGDAEQARQVLAMAREEDAEHEAITAARSALSLAEKSASVGSLAELESRAAAAPNDHAARFDLALALNGAGQRRAAVDRLLEIVERAPQWNEQAARKQLLEFFDAFGADSPITLDGRKRLSALLFR